MTTGRAPRKTPASRRGGNYTIGEASVRSGVSPKMIRHYESLGLLPKVERSRSNYRIYSEADLHGLRFIKRARLLGFSMQDIGTLLGLWQDRQRASAEVRRLADAHLQALDARIAEMQALRQTLSQLVEACQGDERPQCPILEDLGGDSLCARHPEAA